MIVKKTINVQDNKNFLEEFLNVPKRLKKGIRIREIRETIIDQYEIHWGNIL